ncbi:hypothetical protein T5B8_03151 [Salinisphaera sp. T5B8]|uniref:hypothetical protein n=1 Tax=Salinisphaera sp. T5B8 TaxID=1304154 RepID=UPI0033421267
MGNHKLRCALVLVVLLCAQALAFAHAFEHPIALGHGDHVCVLCAHDHTGSAPPGAAAITLGNAPADLATPPINTGPTPPVANGRTARAPPLSFV